MKDLAADRRRAETRFHNYDSRDEGISTDSITATRDALNTLVNVTMQPEGGRLDIVGVPRIESDMAFPSNVTLKFVHGAYLALDLGVTVTINGRIKAPLERIFGGGGTILLTHKVPRVYPQWWGAIGDGVADDKPAGKAAVAACPLDGTVRFPPTASFYKTDISGGESDAIRVTQKITVIIDGKVKSTVGAIQANPPTIFHVLPAAKGTVFKGAGVVAGDGTVNDVNTGTEATAPSLIKVEADGFTWDGITIDTPYKIGIYLWGCYDATITEKTKFTGGVKSYNDTAYFAIRGNQGGKHIIGGHFYPDAAGGMYVNCIFLNNTNHCVFKGCIADRPYEKLLYGAGSYNTAIGCKVFGNPGIIPGTNFAGTVGPVYRLDGIFNKLSHCTSYQCGGGAQSLGGRGSSIEDCDFLECTTGGIGLFDVAVSVNFDNVRVRRCTVTCWNAPTAYVGDGILVRPSLGPSKYIRVDDNTVTGFSKADPLVNTPVWAATTAYPKHSAVKPTVGNQRYYVPQSAGGVSGAVQPVWPLGAGATVVDGTITWVCVTYDVDTYANIRVWSPGAGQESEQGSISRNIVDDCERGISSNFMLNSKAKDNQVKARIWRFIENNGGFNRYEFNGPDIGAANVGIQNVAASSTILYHAV